MRPVHLTLLYATPAFGGEILANYSPLCPETSALGPSAGEERHLAATLLTPTSYPFSVTAVRAKLYHGTLPNARCDASGAHRVGVYVTGEGAPPASPEARGSLTFAAEEVLGDERWLSATLDSPIVLQDGQNLLVTIDFGGTYPTVGCVATCLTGALADRAFWSNANQPPFDWRPLASFGIRSDLFIEAVGDGPAPPPSEAPPPTPEASPTRNRRR